MPAAADSSPLSPLQTSNCPSPAALATIPRSGRLVHSAVDDTTLISELIGSEAAGSLRDTPAADLLEASEDVLATLGLRPAARRRLLAAGELARRFQPSARPSEPCNGPIDLLPHLTDLRTARTEVLGVMSLDAGCSPLGGFVPVAYGGLMHVTVMAREVFAPAIERHAAAVVLAHNHPSGSLEPSPEDIDFTRQMSRAAGVLGIRLLDHLVVARRGYLSLREAGLWDPEQPVVRHRRRR